MPARQITGAFRQAVLPGTAPLAFNLIDVNAPTGGTLPNRTQGATLVDQIQFRPTIGQKWQISGWSITVNPWIVTSAGKTYGTLGDIRGGISTVQAPTNGSFFGTPVPWTFPTLDFPGDNFLLAELFNGATDPPPPSLPPSPTSFPSPSPLVITNPLPQPVDIGPGENLAIGLWVSPSIASGNWNIGLTGAKWAIFYDQAPAR